MKTKSLTTLAAALFLGTCTMAFAQEATTSTEMGAAAATAVTTGDDLEGVCSDVDLTSMQAVEVADAIAMATKAQISRLTDCEDETVAALPEEVVAAINANAVITSVIQQRLVTVGDILGVGVVGDSATIYVREESEEETSTTPTP